ncbi:MAG: UvrD-helicase domain-containing protein [Bacteroidetes bacterium]|nr:UvrD-helicase domain-containing protein [Bacteroidota bacterium]MBL0140349.1 UvrD-helicase domain-containing protein [Bacteroidota bacterium]
MKKTKIRLISASAGSGKTHRLTEEFAAFISSVGNYNFHPSQVIATTFTRLAAGELADRVRRKIIDEGDIEKASVIDQAMIGTVNSIGGQLLSLFAFEGGFSPTLHVIEEEEKELLFQKALSLVFNDASSDALVHLEAKFNLQGDLAIIRSFIQQVVDSVRMNGIGVEKLNEFKDDSIKEYLSRIPDAKKSLVDIRKQIVDFIKPLRKIIEDLNDTTNDTQKLLKDLELFSYRIDNGHSVPWSDWAKLAKSKVGAKSRKDGAFDLIQEILNKHIALKEFQQDIREYISFVFEKAAECLTVYENLKKERGLIDFTDQEASLLNLLDKPEVQAEFKNKFKVILVDEFQDTSPLQLALFVKMANLLEHVIWVGDPKQAIYGFRGGDAQLINAVLRIFGKIDPQDILTQSRRSRPDLLNLTNSIFLPAFKKADDLLTEEQIILKPYRKERSEYSPAFESWGFTWNSPGGQVNKDSLEKYISNLAVKIQNYLEDPAIKIEEKSSGVLRNVRPGDLAILCKTNNECRSIARILRNHGIQSVVSNSGLSLTAEWRLLKACLCLANDKYDSLARAEILFLVEEGHSMPSIIEDRLSFLSQEQIEGIDWKDDHPWISWILKNHDQFRQPGLELMIRKILNGLPVQNLVMQWGNAAQRTANMQQILNYANQFDAYAAKLGSLADINGFITWFEQLVEDEIDERGLFVSDQAVNILTYHRAKGLEWPVVILFSLDNENEPDIFDKIRVLQNTELDLSRPLNGRVLRFWPWPYGEQRDFPPFTDKFGDAKELSIVQILHQQESLRLFYVGCTRARDYLIFCHRTHKKQLWLERILPGGVKSIVGDDDRPGIVNSKLEGCSIRCNVSVSSYSDIAQTTVSEMSTVNVYKEYSNTTYSPYLINPSSQPPPPEAKILNRFQISEPLVLNQKIEGESAEFGTCFHQLYCALDPEMPAVQAVKLINSHLVTYGFEKCIDAGNFWNGFRKFHTFLQEKYSPLRMHKEWPMMQEKDGSLIRGVADLVLETKDSILIIDYKTFTGHESELESKALSYAGQLSTYGSILKETFKKPVSDYLYFPVYGSLIEISG